MNEPKTILVPLFLVAQGLLVHRTGNFEKPPSKPDLTQFPAQVASWHRVSEQLVDPATQEQLGADRLMNSMYQQPNGEFANVFVAWFQSQRAGTSQPHSPQVCLPASGWVPESTGTIAIDTTAGAITVNKYVVANGAEKAVVLYWYQTPRRVVAGEWMAKFWLMIDAVRDRRTDTSIVRVTTWVKNGDVSGPTRIAAGLAQSLYPLLRETFPK